MIEYQEAFETTFYDAKEVERTTKKAVKTGLVFLLASAIGAGVMGHYRRYEHVRKQEMAATVVIPLPSEQSYVEINNDIYKISYNDKQQPILQQVR